MIYSSICEEYRTDNRQLQRIRNGHRFKIYEHNSKDFEKERRYSI